MPDRPRVDRHEPRRGDFARTRGRLIAAELAARGLPLRLAGRRREPLEYNSDRRRRDVIERHTRIGVTSPRDLRRDLHDDCMEQSGLCFDLGAAEVRGAAIAKEEIGAADDVALHEVGDPVVVVRA